MKFRNLFLGMLGAVVVLTGVAVSKAAFAAEQFFPMLVYRTGPYAPSGIPVANGFARLWQITKEKLRQWPFPY